MSIAVFLRVLSDHVQNFPPKIFHTACALSLAPSQTFWQNVESCNKTTQNDLENTGTVTLKKSLEKCQNISTIIIKKHLSDLNLKVKLSGLFVDSYNRISSKSLQRFPKVSSYIVERHRLLKNGATVLLDNGVIFLFSAVSDRV